MADLKAAQLADLKAAQSADLKAAQSAHWWAAPKADLSVDHSVGQKVSPMAALMGNASSCNL
jgi:hypothetical protein